MPALRRVRWSPIYGWTVVWLCSFSIPAFEQWLFASRQGWGDAALLWSSILDMVRALGTVVLGFALGWQRRWAALFVAAVLGAMAGSLAVWVASAGGWSNDTSHPLAQPILFLLSCVILGLTLWFGAGMAALVRVARRHRQELRSGSAR